MLRFFVPVAGEVMTSLLSFVSMNNAIGLCPEVCCVCVCLTRKHNFNHPMWGVPPAAFIGSLPSGCL
jgi:hypothetical protein